MKAKYHDLQNEEHELTLKNGQLKNDINVLKNSLTDGYMRGSC